MLASVSHAQSLVTEGPDGLVYSPYANQGQSNAVNTVPDFSRAGYQGGGVAIPFAPVQRTLTPSGGGDTLTLDAPLVQTIEDQYGGGTVEEFTYPGALENVGIEALRAESTFTSSTDEDHGWYVVRLERVRNGWIRQVTSRYFGRGLATVNKNSLFVTVEDCAHLDPVSTTAGGNRYSYNINQSSYILFQRCYARNGRHDFVSGSRTPGPNAFVDGFAIEALNDIGPHQRYATGQVYDNIKCEDNPNDQDDALRVQNRTTSGSGHGWSGAQIMF